LSVYPDDDPTFKSVIKVIEDNVDFHEDYVSLYGITPSVQNNSEKMMNYFFCKKNLKFTLDCMHVVYEEFGGTIADDRGMWQDPEVETVPITLEVKDKSHLIINSVG